MGYFIFSILIGHIINYFLTTIVIKVDIHIGHRNTVGIQEPLEQQIVLHRIDVGDSDTVRYHRASRRTTAGTDQHIHFPGFVNEILHNQEIAREAHRFNGFQLKFNPFFYFIRTWFSISGFSAIPGKLRKVIGFEFHPEHLFVSAQTVKRFLSEFFDEHGLGISVSVIIHFPKLFRNWKNRHNRS